MAKVIANPHCTLDVERDYRETVIAECSSRCMEEHEKHLTEWVGRGTIAGLSAKAYYYTTEADGKLIDEQDSFDCIDWMERLERVEIVTDDDVEVARIYNDRYAQS